MSLLLLFGRGPRPENTVLPVITGLAQVGHSVVTTTGTWTNSPTSYSYQWFRALTDGTGVSLTAILRDENGDPLGDTITGATSAQYLVTSADVGGLLFVEVTATNAAGSTYVDVIFPDVVKPALDTDGGFARKKNKRKYKALVELDEFRAELSAIERLRKLTEVPQRPVTAEIKRNDDEEALLALMDY